MLTQLLNDRGDWRGWIRDAWQQGVTAADLMAMRPAQLMATFFSPIPAGETDPLAKLTADNDVRGKKGLRPTCPLWLKTLLTERTRGDPAKRTGVHRPTPPAGGRVGANQAAHG